MPRKPGKKGFQQRLRVPRTTDETHRAILILSIERQEYMHETAEYILATHPDVVEVASRERQSRGRMGIWRKIPHQGIRKCTVCGYRTHDKELEDCPWCDLKKMEEGLAKG